MTWTAETIGRLRELWAKGYSASLIAAELGRGISKNAVLGKRWRMGLPDRQARKSPHGPSKRRPRGVAPKKRAPKAWHLPEPLNVPEAKKLPLDVLTQRTCRWPIGDPREADFYFCGHDCPAALPYCTYHMRVAYREGTSTPLERRVRERLEAA